MLLGAVVTAEIDSIERYLEETLGLAVRLSAWNASDRLPIYLRDGYRFYAAELLGMQCLFMVDRADEAPSPARVRKQMGQGRAQVGRRAGLREDAGRFAPT